MALKGQPIAIGTSDTTIYTCPASTEASVHGLVFANNTGSAVTVTVKIYIQSTGVTTTVATGLSVTANSTLTWPKPIDVNAADVIKASASSGSAIVCLYSVYEGSAPAVAVGFTPRGAWSSGATYAINDVVSYSGSSYLASQASSAQQPDTATTYWMVLASKGDTGTGDLSGPSSSVDSEIALFSSTTGKVIKRASLSGLVKATSGVASAATAGTDYLAPPSGTAILKANSGGALANATAGTDYVAPSGALGTPSSGTLTSCTGLPLTTGVTGTLPVGNGGSGATTLTGVIKGNGTSAFTAATAGTDYLAPPSGTAILKANSGGALANATAGTDYVAPGGALGTPSSGTLTNATGLPISTGVSGLGTGVATAAANAVNASAGFITYSSFAPASGKTLTVSNSLTLAGTDSTTMTFPGASCNVGYLEVPQNSQSAAYTAVLADSGKHIFHPSTDNNARTFTIPANGSVAYPVGTVLTFVNMANTVTIAITTDTMYLAGTGTTGPRTLAAYGVATAIKMTSTTWIISGSGLT